MTSGEFGALRSILWPVHRSELKKVLSMFLLLLFLCINYSILRNLKDTVILTAKSSGAEVIPFIKVWGMLPAAILAAWIYAKLSAKFTREKIFYLFVSGFLSFFLLFAFIIYPYREQLNFTEFQGYLSTYLPLGFKGPIALVCNWTYTCFYIISELWAVLVLSVLFWGYANEITQISQAKRYYGILNIGSNIAPVFGGFLALVLSQKVFVHVNSDSWQQTLINLVLMVTLFGLIAMALFYWMNRHIDKEQENVPKKQKIKFSLKESFQQIQKSKYLLSIAILVLGFNIAINITDVLWKEQLKKFFIHPNDMLNHMNQITIGIGLIATLASIGFAFIITRLGWTFAALITPIVMTTMGVLFFTFLFFGETLSPIAYAVFQSTPMALTVYFGSMQNCLSKAGKYSVFDATKELSFLPLDASSRTKGKAAIDGLGSGIGKSGASIVYQSLILLTGGIGACTPFVAVILMVVFFGWISSAFYVGKKFKSMTEKVVTQS